MQIYRLYRQHHKGLFYFINSAASRTYEIASVVVTN